VASLLLAGYWQRIYQSRFLMVMTIILLLIWWLVELNLLAKQHLLHGAVIACSALKEKYRKTLRKDIEDKVCLIYLEGSIKEIRERLTNRKDHFMPAALLKSQFDTLEPPSDAITVAISLPPEDIVDNIRTVLKSM
jgi:gluconokinase